MTGSGAGAPSIGARADPLEGFTHDVDVTAFDRRLARLVPFGLALLVALALPTLGLPLGLAIGVGIAAALGVLIVVFERTRWRAQEVLHGYFFERTRRWRLDTGGDPPRDGGAAAEIWLGRHQPGSVPQLYRVSAAQAGGDDVVYRRELDRMRETTAAERAVKRWAVEVRRFGESGVADADAVRGGLADITDPDDRYSIESWLAIVDAAARRAAGQRDWLVGLAARRAQVRPTSRPMRFRIRLWLSRFVPVIAFVVPATFFGAVSLVAGGRAQIPADYARTELFVRGDVPDHGSDVWSVLQRLEHALPGAVRTQAAPLTADELSELLDESLPTLSWDTGAIELERPSDAGRHRAWTIEVLLGGIGQNANTVLITFDGAAGPTYRYAVDPGVVRSLREALGLPVGAAAD
jgi:hypothetical protein